MGWSERPISHDLAVTIIILFFSNLDRFTFTCKNQTYTYLSLPHYTVKRNPAQKSTALKVHDKTLGILCIISMHYSLSSHLQSIKKILIPIPNKDISFKQQN